MAFKVGRSKTGRDAEIRAASIRVQRIKSSIPEGEKYLDRIMARSEELSFLIEARVAQ